MSSFLSVFRNESGRNLAFEAYDRIIQSGGIIYEDIYLPTSPGDTHIMASGSSSNPPLLLIHAYYASAASWYKNIKALSAKFRVYNIDIIGDPNKSKPTKIIRQHHEFIEWLDEIMAGLKLDSAYFAGNSVGAFHIANYALHAPDRVKKMVLIGPAATFLQIMPFYLHTFPGGMTGWPILVRHAVKWVEHGVEFEPGFKELFTLLLRYGKATNQVFPLVFSDEQLKSMKAPTLLIYGDMEAIYPVESAIKRAKQCIENLSVEVIERGNHITAATNHEMVNKAILDFLN